MLNLNLWVPKPSKPPGQQAENSAPDSDVPRPLLRVVILNTKGGCGKSTLATNLAAYYASHDYRTALLDADPQASSLHWLQNRDGAHKAITAINGADRSLRVTRSFRMRVPPGIERLIVDTPAALDSVRLQDMTRDADAILIPVLPSDIDIHAVSRCIAELLLAGRVEQRSERVAVIANRVKKNTLVYTKLQRFLGSLGITFVASLRDTQNYVHASEWGLGIHELEAQGADQDALDWEPLIQWLEQRPAQTDVTADGTTAAQAVTQSPG